MAEEITAWQTRPLDVFYPILYIDALMVKVRDGGAVDNNRGIRDVLFVCCDGLAGITEAIESINFQLRKIIKNRGHFPDDDAR